MFKKKIKKITSQLPKWNIIQTTKEQQDHLKFICKLGKKKRKRNKQQYERLIVNRGKTQQSKE